jgi:fatty-acyl-CoA synthase
MMDYPLTLTHFFERSRRLWAKKTIATRVPGAPLFRYTDAEFVDRTLRLAGLLDAMGLRTGDRMATFAWNSHRHLELYWAAPLTGRVLHTLNIRLSPQDLTYIRQSRRGQRDLRRCERLARARGHPRQAAHRAPHRDHARHACCRGAGRPRRLRRVARRLTTGRALARARGDAGCGHMLHVRTTGHPKGVVYTHRAIFLHCLAQAIADQFGISESDTILHIVPMFHASSWCMPFTAVMTGATQVFAGPNPSRATCARSSRRNR